MSQWSRKTKNKNSFQSSPSTSLINNVVVPFRESSKKFVVEILTKNLPLNLSGALFFLGLGCSLKWWYKDQLFMVLLKQNLPAFTESQQILSWETGEYLLKEQNRHFAEKKTTTWVNSNSSDRYERLSSNVSDSVTFQTLPPLRNQQVVQKTSQADALLSLPTSLGKKLINVNNIDNKNDASPLVKHHFIERIDFYPNHVAIEFKSPWHKHVHQRFVGIFSEPAQVKEYKIDQNQIKRLRSTKSNVFSLFHARPFGCCTSQSEEVGNAKHLDSKESKFLTYREGKPLVPHTWFKLSARGLCILNEEHSLTTLQPRTMLQSGQRRIWTSLRQPIPIPEFSAEFSDYLLNSTSGNVDGSVILCTKLAKLCNTLKDSKLSTELCKFDLRGHFIKANVAKKTTVGGDRENSAIRWKKRSLPIERCSYPLELTKRMAGWQPPINTLIFNSYLDELPYKLESSLPPFLSKKDSQLLSLSGSFLESTIPLLTPSSLPTHFLQRNFNDECGYPFKTILSIDDKKTRLTESVIPAQEREVAITGEVVISKEEGNKKTRDSQNKTQIGDTSHSSANDTSPFSTGGRVAHAHDLSTQLEGGAQQPGRLSTSSNELGSLEKKPSETLLKKLQLIEMKQLLKSELQFLMNTLSLTFVENQYSRVFAKSRNDLPFRAKVDFDKYINNSLKNHTLFPSVLLPSSLEGVCEAKVVPPTEVKRTVQKRAETSSTNEVCKAKEIQKAFDEAQIFHYQKEKEYAKGDSRTQFQRFALESEKFPLSSLSMIEKSTDSLFLLNTLGFTFNNLSSLNNPPILLPVNSDGSLWMWQLPLCVKLTQKKMTVANLNSLNPVDKGVKFFNKTTPNARIMSGYIYPDIPTASLRPKLSRWLAASEKLTSYCPISLREQNEVYWFLYPHLFRGMNRFVDQACLKSVKIPITPTTFLSRFFHPPINRGINEWETRISEPSMPFERSKTSNGFFLYGGQNVASSILAKPPRAFQSLENDRSIDSLQKLTDQHFSFAKHNCVNATSIPLIEKKGENETGTKHKCTNIKGSKAVESSHAIPTLGTLHAYSSTPCKAKKLVMEKEVVQNKEGDVDPLVRDFTDFVVTTSLGGNLEMASSFPYEKLHHHLAYFPGFDLGVKKHLIDCNARGIAYHGIVVQRNKMTKDFQPFMITSLPHPDQHLNMMPIDLKRSASCLFCPSCSFSEQKEQEEQEGKHQEHKKEKRKNNGASLRQSSAWGTLLLGPENPLTDRQCHFFGQKQLSPLDINSLQRDYLRQLGKEIVTQSNPKGLTEKLSSSERTKILSLSKGVNSFFFKKRKYTYLLEKKDQWHLLFQEHLRTALENTKKYPPLTPEERKNNGFGRVKISAPLLMTRFPREIVKHGKATQYFPSCLFCPSYEQEEQEGQDVKDSQAQSGKEEKKIVWLQDWTLKKSPVPQLQHGISWRPSCHLESSYLSPLSIRNSIGNHYHNVFEGFPSSGKHLKEVEAKQTHVLPALLRNDNVFHSQFSTSPCPSCSFSEHKEQEEQQYNNSLPQIYTNRGKSTDLLVSGSGTRSVGNKQDRLIDKAPLSDTVFSLTFQSYPLVSISTCGVHSYEGHGKDRDMTQLYYPLLTERKSFELNTASRLHKATPNSALIGNLQLLIQEPLTTNSWTVIGQWFFLIALLFWIEQILVDDVFPALFALEQILLGATGIKTGDRTHILRISKGDAPKFQHLAGINGLLGELSELVLFLRGQQNIGERFWNKKSSYGVLLTGSPGTGKTFLVRALANEARVPVLILSAGTLISNKLNSNNNKPSWSIRHAFRRAKQLAPCILFIDEIDALGKSRGKILTDINEIVTDTNLGSPDFSNTPKNNQNKSTPSGSKLFTSQSESFNCEQFLQNGSSVSNLMFNEWEYPLKSTILQESNKINRSSLCEEKLFDLFNTDKSTGLFTTFASSERNQTISDTSLPTNSSTTIQTGESFLQEGVNRSNQEEASQQRASSAGNENATSQRKFGPLTQLLVSMDGVSNLSGVLIMGATNRPELLDPALTRPGRFERVIRIEKPSEQKRIEILQLYSRNLGVQKKMPWSYFANRTLGLTAADLAVAMNYSSLRAILYGSAHTIETIEYGLDSITRHGKQPKGSFDLSFSQRKVVPTIRDGAKQASTTPLPPLKSTKQKSSWQHKKLAQLAYYQAGKIVVQTLLPQHPPVSLIRINLFGITQSTSADTYIPIEGTSQTQCCSFLESRLIGLYGGKAASLLLEYHYKAKEDSLNLGFKAGAWLLPKPQVNVEDMKLKGLEKVEIGFAGAGNNLFQSNIGTLEIQIATRLATAMVNNWNFYFSPIDRNKLPLCVLSIERKAPVCSSTPYSYGTNLGEVQESSYFPFLRQNKISSFDNLSPASKEYYLRPSETARTQKTVKQVLSARVTSELSKKRGSLLTPTERVRLAEDTENPHFLPPGISFPRELEVYKSSFLEYYFRHVTFSAKVGSQASEGERFVSNSPIDSSISQRVNRVNKIEHFDQLRHYFLKRKSNDVKEKRTVLTQLTHSTGQLHVPKMGLPTQLEELRFAVSQSKNSLKFCGNTKFSSSNKRISIEDVGEKTSSQTDLLPLVNSLQFSNSQRDRFYPGWFRLYLPDIEATEFLKNVANYYFSLGLQTLTRPSVSDLLTKSIPLAPIFFSNATNTTHGIQFHGSNSGAVQSKGGKDATLIQNVFFCRGSNNLSIGFGLLRNAAKRRNQLNIKSQYVFKLPLTIEDDRSKQISKEISYSHTPMTLWGFEKPWNISRLINTGFRQNASLATATGIKGPLALTELHIIKEQTLKTTRPQLSIQHIPINIHSKEPLSKREKRQGNTSIYTDFTVENKKSGRQVRVSKPKESISTALNVTASILKRDQNSLVACRQDQAFASEYSCIPLNKKVAKIDGFGYFGCFATHPKQPKELEHQDVSFLLSLEKQMFPINFSAISVAEKEFLYHTLISNCFAKAFLLINQNRQLLDYFADYLIRFQILRQHQILYLFSTILLSYEKQT